MTRKAWMLVLAGLVVALKLPAAELSWIKAHALRPSSDVVADLEREVAKAQESGSRCKILVGPGLLESPALLFVQDGFFHPRPLRDAEASTLGMRARQVDVACSPGSVRDREATLGDPSEGVVRVDLGGRIAGTIAVTRKKLPESKTEGTIALALRVETAAGTTILYSPLKDRRGEMLSYQFDGRDVPTGISIAELVLCVDRVAISNSVPLVLVVARPLRTPRA